MFEPVSPVGERAEAQEAQQEPHVHRDVPSHDGEARSSAEGRSSAEAADTGATQGRILVVDDDLAMAKMVQQGLGRRGYRVAAVTTAEAALTELAGGEFDVVLTDLKLDGQDGLSLCERAIGMCPDVPVVVMTAFGSMDAAIAAIRAGAYDFINKPVELEALAVAMRRAVDHRRLTAEVRRLRQTVARAEPPGSMVGQSRAMRAVYDLVERVGPSDATVLILGESGTGKELVARGLHERSERRNGPFIAINCAAMPPTLLESELFGHMRGAFTDAKTSRDGLFVQATGGTLFLDEIGEMPPEMQPKLLRALQERRVRPIGASKEKEFDARIIAASNRDMDAEVEEGRFREDLYYRINVVGIKVPPLRARGHDILLLAQHFVDRIGRRMGKDVRRLTAEAARKLLDYDWPGNVRELENCVERAVTLARYDEITLDDLPERIRDYRSSRVVVDTHDPSELITLEELERRYVDRVLSAVGQNKTQAAKILGVDRRTLYRKLARYQQGKEEDV
jgi:DNA-binding NtrC family response regulator